MDRLEALRLLTATFPPTRSMPERAALQSRARDIPWEPMAELATHQGVAPLVSFNIEHRLGATQVPAPVRDQLLGFFQGTLNDNVFRLVELKKMLAEVGVPVLLVEATAYADALYPHIALRPVSDLQLLVARRDFMRLAEATGRFGFRVEGPSERGIVLSDGRIKLLAHDLLQARESAAAELYERGIPARVYGETVRRPAIEDALLAHVALLALGGMHAPLVEYVDLRELVLGSPAQGGTWERPPDPAVVRERAEAFGLERALYCAMSLLVGFFPAVAEAAGALTPEIGAAMRATLEVAVVQPGRHIERDRINRGADQVRKLLLK